MTTNLERWRTLRTWVALLFLLCEPSLHARHVASPSGRPLTGKRVLLLYSNVLALPAHRKNSDAFLSVMEASGVPVTNLHYEFLDLVRNSSASYRTQLPAWLTEKYSGAHIDSIITIDGAAKNFMLNEGRRLFPDAPLISVLSPHPITEPVPGRKVVQIVALPDYAGTLESALQLFPATKSVFVVIGASEDEKLWLPAAQKAYAPWKNRLTFEFSNAMTHSEMLERARHLPPDAILIYLAFYQDSAGEPFVPRAVAAEISAASTRPVFSHYDSLIGTGIVGGSLFSYEAEGSRAAHLARDLMTGALQLRDPMLTLTSLHRPMFDWNQLKRWNVEDAVLPANALVLNRPYSLWEKYRWYVLGAALVGLLQSVLIAALLVQRRLRQQAQTTLRESEERFRVLVEHAPDAVCVVDMDTGRFIDANPQAEILFGCHRERLLRSSPFEFFLPNQPDSLPLEVTFREHGESALAGKIPRFERALRALTGEEKFCEVRLVHLPPRTKRLIRASYLDVTERKSMEERLRQAEKMDAIGQLAGGVAHDFNNQLSAITGFAEMLLESLQGDERRLANNILNAAMRAAELTKNLLAFSRKGRFLSARVDVHAVIAEVIALLQCSIDRRIRILQILEARPSLTIGDPTQIQNALLNLAINARDAMPEGGDLTFATDNLELTDNANEFELPPGRYLQVRVEDTGSGIPREVQKRMFEPFFTTKPSGKGTGLGLAAVYGMVKGHKGGMQVVSEVGRGTTFRICFPILERPEDVATPAQAATVSEGGHHHVLVVDDDESVRSMLGEMLTKHGHRVTLCADGVEAVASYGASWKEIDIVILDMIMPRMGGRDTYLALRQINPEVKVILVSGYSINGQAQAILDAGVLDFLQKPFQAAELVRKIGAACAKEKSMRQKE